MDLTSLLEDAVRSARPFVDRTVGNRNRGRGEALGAGRRTERAGRTAAEAARDLTRRRGLALGAGRRAALRDAETALDLATSEETRRIGAERVRDAALNRAVREGQGRLAAEAARDTAKGRAGKVLKLAGKLKIGNKKLRRGLIFGLPAAAVVAGGAGFAGGYIKGKKDAPTKVISPPYEDIKRPGVNAPSYRGADTGGLIAGGSSPSSAVGGQSGGGYRGGQSSMTDTMKRNQRAVRDAKSYLGEAFDATVQKGVATGRKHLAAMLQRDGVDDETGVRLMKRYDKEIGSQESLKGYKTSGVTEEFDAENPNKRGALLSAYRGKYAAGTTLQQMREKASASR